MCDGSSMQGVFNNSCIEQLQGSERLMEFLEESARVNFYISLATEFFANHAHVPKMFIVYVVLFFST